MCHACVSPPASMSCDVSGSHASLNTREAHNSSRRFQNAAAKGARMRVPKSYMNLKRLALDGVQVGCEGACIVMDSVAGSGCLEVLSLCACGIGPKCSASLEQLLQSSAPIQKLDLGFNMCAVLHPHTRACGILSRHIYRFCFEKIASCLSVQQNLFRTPLGEDSRVFSIMVT
jgi:hypothetical protein